MKRLTILGFIIFFILNLFLELNGQLLYVWDHENNSFSFPDPDTGEYIDGTLAISSLLTEIGVDFERGFDLPANPVDYDIILVMLGSFCES
ncbi:MAG: hypothetical protein JXB60_03380 [Candidatus Cloacimonetes bacterium]|nr:hypothetical protein [Candidatus Cloacimonadota bacterium]